ncbi:hypothetical protein O181_038393 [Austropuccinia psidii MF-1]|uniref:Uncharacterized protein n=1 Tax=Austropuccinia psidii MF-1 TaxID=1389203 RepID=A0A9Q3DBC0_9BASI|nr:hypothetical protein [Austropuccinia psidii MF-1]
MIIRSARFDLRLTLRHTSLSHKLTMLLIKLLGAFFILASACRARYDPQMRKWLCIRCSEDNIRPANGTTKCGHQINCSQCSSKRETCAILISVQQWECRSCGWVGNENAEQVATFCGCKRSEHNQCGQCEDKDKELDTPHEPASSSKGFMSRLKGKFRYGKIG